MEFIKEILNIIDILTSFYLIFYIITGLCILKDKNKPKHGNKKYRFAVVIPARNEEKVIGNLIKSLKNENYPKELYDVFVVVNNCTDRTKEIVLENDAKVIECERPVASKGSALRVAFSKLKESNYDAYLIFDADNIVHPDFISKMNDALCDGYEIAQGYRDSKNPSSTWISSAYSVHYLIHNIFVNQSRMNIDKSCFINGTGFMISKKFLERRTFKAHTLTEDIELTVKCALYDEKIAYVEDAITYDEQVETFRESWKQRKRWAIGTFQCVKYYVKKLAKKAVRKDSFSCADALIFLISPLIQLLGTASYLTRILVTFVQGLPMNYTIKLFGLLVGYTAGVILSISAVRYSKKKISVYIKGILTLPIYILSWIPINIVALFTKKNKWEQIEHTKDVTIDSMLEI